MQASITKQPPTNDDVEAVKKLVQDRFSQRSSEAHQRRASRSTSTIEETMSAYYKRARSMMERVGARDSPEMWIPLSPQEMAFLDGTVPLMTVFMQVTE